MRSITLIYSVATLALSLGTSLTNAADGSNYTSPLPADKTFVVNISDPSSAPLADGTPAVNFYITIQNLDMTQFGLANSYTLPSYLTDASQNSDLCEVFIGNIFAATGIVPAIQFPSDMAGGTGFMTQRQFNNKYNLQAPSSGGGGGGGATAPTA